MITPKQKKLYDFIADYFEENGYGPNFDEMRDYMGASSTSGIHRLLKVLTERGYVRKLSNKARAIAPAKAIDCNDAMGDRKLLTVISIAKSWRDSPVSADYAIREICFALNLDNTGKLQGKARQK